MEESPEFYHEMADQTAEQAQLLLGLDRVSTQNLINEIKIESNLKIKYSKLLHILIDRLTSIQRNHINFPIECKEAIEKIRIYNPTVPNNPKEFLRWVPGQFENFSTSICSFKNKINRSQKKLHNLINKENENIKAKEIAKEIEREKEKGKEYQTAKTSPRTKGKHEIDHFSLDISGKSKMNKSIECDQELTTLREKYSLISTQVAELKQTVSKAPLKMRIIKEKLKNATEAIDELKSQNEKLKTELSQRIEDLDQEKLLNVSREKKFNEIKDKMTKYGNELLKKEKDLYDSMTSGDYQESLKMQLKTMSDHLKSVEKERNDFRIELDSLTDKFNDINADNNTLKAQCSILQNDNIALKKENQNMSQMIQGHEASGYQLNSQIQQSDLQQFSLESRLRNAQNECKSLQSKIVQFQEHINKQNKEIVRLETTLTKTKDDLHSITRKFEDNKTDSLSMQRYGFLLADAICQKFNPKNSKDEIERLLNVVREEHIQLSESARVKLNPFDVSTNACVSSPDFQSIHSKFDQLDQELATLTFKEYS